MNEEKNIQVTEVIPKSWEGNDYKHVIAGGETYNLRPKTKKGDVIEAYNIINAPGNYVVKTWKGATSKNAMIMEAKLISSVVTGNTSKPNGNNNSSIEWQVCLKSAVELLKRTEVEKQSDLQVKNTADRVLMVAKIWYDYTKKVLDGTAKDIEPVGMTPAENVEDIPWGD